MSAQETGPSRAEWNTGISAVLSEAAVHGHTMGLKVLAKQLLTSTTVEALAAKLGVVRTDSFAN